MLSLPQSQCFPRSPVPSTFTAETCCSGDPSVTTNVDSKPTEDQPSQEENAAAKAPSNICVCWFPRAAFISI